ncbi:MAG TPA: adenine phosphoribosyltransferase [Candidatus Nanopelagicales bacterium]|nr:adenine phosphoribosyltransferase [Candidatus Nanopelagicales bacterium]
MSQPLGRLWDEVVVVPDFPEPGISFKDLSGILANPETLAITVQAWIEAIGPERPTMIVGIEARGFPLGAALAYELGCGFVALRKAGKLPRDVHRQEYSLEYGTASLELHTDALGPADQVVIVDDVLATGGTLGAGVDLVQRSGAQVLSAAVVMDLPALNGRAELARRGIPVHVLISDSE